MRFVWFPKSKMMVFMKSVKEKSSMNVLWIVNMVFPAVAKELGICETIDQCMMGFELDELS